jgi:hypothetical protein
MYRTSGRHFSMSYFRRLVTDLMHFSAKVPSVTLERRMNLNRLVTARHACNPQPTWSAIFLKAFALVAARTPVLRTSYLNFPWPHFYEHPTNIATVNVDREIENERVVLYAHITTPENRPLQDIDAIIHEHQNQPAKSIQSYRRAVRLSRVPWPLRRPIWWAGLNIIGSIRCRYFGTFGITSVGSQGVGITRLVSLLTSQLHYGIFDSTGALDMRLSFDHRVLDGARAAKGLADLETVLLGEMLRECSQCTGNGVDRRPMFPAPDRS